MELSHLVLVTILDIVLYTVSMDNIVKANITPEMGDDPYGSLGNYMVFVISSDKKPLDPCNPARARKLLNQGKASVFKQYPFTIILKSRWSFVSKTSEYRLKIDPGSKVAGLAIVSAVSSKVIWSAEIQHRGSIIKRLLEARRGIRRSRRNRKTRYRKARFMNRRRQGQFSPNISIDEEKNIKGKGWLPPSLCSRMYNVETWVRRLRKLCPIKTISYELTKFDTQRMQNPDISGVEYQQGELAGYDVREYLLEKYERKCVYCGAKDVPLEVEHVIPKDKDGSDRVSNLVISCRKCNMKKANKSIEEFLKSKPDQLAKIKRQLKEPLKDTASMNATRWALFNNLKALGLPIEIGTGATTKYNRVKHNLPKEHWIDAACVGLGTPDNLDVGNIKPLCIKAVGHGSRQMCSVNKYGFPNSKPKSGKIFFGFQTHDIVKACIDKGEKAGKYIGRIKSVRKTGSFTIDGGIIDLNASFRKLQNLQHADGYSYNYKVVDKSNIILG